MDAVILTAWFMVVIALLYSLMVLAISIPLYREETENGNCVFNSVHLCRDSGTE